MECLSPYRRIDGPLKRETDTRACNFLIAGDWKEDSEVKGRRQERKSFLSQIEIIENPKTEVLDPMPQEGALYS